MAKPTEKFRLRAPTVAETARATSAAERSLKKLLQKLAVQQAAARSRPDLSLAGCQLGDKGIFVGTFEPMDDALKGLGIVFNVFAAPEDVPDVKGQSIRDDFYAVAARVAELKGWHGHNGSYYSDARALRDALKKGDYHGEWVIPTFQMLAQVYMCKNKNDLAGTFIDDTPRAALYATCSEDRDNRNYVWNTDFNSGYSTVHLKENIFRCRPVRLELRPPNKI